MPFDSSRPAPPAEVPSGLSPGERERRSPQPPLTLGVFNYDGAWKIYCEFERAAPYPARNLAIAVAESRAFEAVRCGRRVELFIQEENGELRQVAVELH